MRATAILLMSALVGCGGPTGPASTNTTSDALPSLAQRVEFLERYVTFRRQYQELGFHIVYHNNGGGGVPGPSDWDIRVVAVVPPEQLPQWLPPDGAPAPAHLDTSVLIAPGRAPAWARPARTSRMRRSTCSREHQPNVMDST